MNRRAYARVQEHFEQKQAELDLLKRKRDEEAKLTLKSLAPEDRGAIIALAQDFSRVWNAETTDMVTRKNLLRCLIEDVTITRDGLTAHVGIRWKTQAHTTLTVQLVGNLSGLRLPARVIEFIKELAPDHTDRQIAEALNESGIMNGRGRPFCKKRVKRIRERYQIMKHPLDCSPDRRDDGLYSSIAVARMLRVNNTTVSVWCQEGRLDGVQEGVKRRWWINTTPEELEKFEKTIRRQPNRRSKSGNSADKTRVSVLRGDKRDVDPKGDVIYVNQELKTNKNIAKVSFPKQ
jgi:hypothetical protein